MSPNSLEVNAQFLEIINSGLTDHEKSAQLTKAGSGLLRVFVEQEGFSGRILPPQGITREAMIPTGIDGTWYIRRPIDNADRIQAVETSPVGYPTGRYISGKDFVINVSYKESEVIEKDTRELQDTWTYDIQDIYENRIGLGMQRKTDKIFMKQILTGLGWDTTPSTGGGLLATGSKQIVDFRSFHGATGVSTGILPAMITEMKQKFGMKAASEAQQTVANLAYVPNPTKPLMAATVLMNLYDWEDFSEMPATDLGSIIRAEYFHQYKLNTFKNLNIVTTLHSDLCPRGNMFFFTTPEFIGYNFEVDPIQVKTKVDTFLHKLMMKAEALNGIGIGNIYSFWHMLFTPRGSEITTDAPNILTGTNFFGNKFDLTA
jgi:hypothetical protein